MTKSIGAFVTFLLVASLVMAFAQEINLLEESNRVLENELALARMSVLYMVINLEEKAILLKSRGMVLRKWDVQKFKLWGRPIPAEVFKLSKKSALIPPKRPNITPGKEDEQQGGKKDTVELGVLELDDMPVHYSLTLEEGIRISVRPRTKRFWPALMNFGKSVSWFTFLPLKTIWLTLKKKPFTEVELIMPTEKDARGIYWSYLEGQGTIVSYKNLK